MRPAKKFAAASFLLTSCLTPAHASQVDLSNWTYKQLVAQTLFVCSSGASLEGRKYQVEAGLGGIALVGPNRGASIAKSIKRLKAASPRKVPVWIASDEEGGAVQRLRRAIYPLPSALEMGKWSNRKLENTAYNYGLRMKKLGVNLAFSPVADLSVTGSFIANSGRSFGTTAFVVSQKVAAWSKGLIRAGIEPTVKHWPGHGAVGDTHKFPRSTKNISEMQNELKPFLAGIRSGVRVVMVGHLFVPGLTEDKTPASRSTKALAYLREQVGSDGVIVTDSLSMGGALTGLKGDVVEAAVRSLVAGADVALVCSGPRDLVSQVASRLSTRLERSEVEVKVYRILKLKKSFRYVKSLQTTSHFACGGGEHH